MSLGGGTLEDNKSHTMATRHVTSYDLLEICRLCGKPAKKHQSWQSFCGRVPEGPQIWGAGAFLILTSFGVNHLEPCQSQSPSFPLVYEKEIKRAHTHTQLLGRCKETVLYQVITFVLATKTTQLNALWSLLCWQLLQVSKNLIPAGQPRTTHMQQP